MTALLVGLGVAAWQRRKAAKRIQRASAMEWEDEI
jgi:hypothetical protein